MISFAQKACCIILLLFFACEKIENSNAKTIGTEKEVSFKPPLMGWASWNNYRIHINESIIKSQADAMVDLGLDEVGYQFINTDDGFYGGRDKEGNLLVHKERFPNGMKQLAEYIHAKGLKAGIYTDAGISTCASYWDKDTIGVGMGLYGNDYRDLNLYLKEWKYDFIKVDWCGGDWLELDEEIRYTEIGNIIREINPSVIYNVCRWKFPGKWVTKVADSWRISGDINKTFESVMHIIDINADLWRYASNGRYNDMDMLQVGRGMTYEEDKAHFSMWCIMQSPLLLGNDLTKMSEETLEIISNKEVIAINQNPFTYQGRRMIDYGALEVWAKPLFSANSGKVAVVLLNRSEKEQAIAFDLQAVSIDSSKGYTMRDLWTKKDFPISWDADVEMRVPAHGVIVLKITGKSIPYNVFEIIDKNNKLPPIELKTDF